MIDLFVLIAAMAASAPATEANPPSVDTGATPATDQVQTASADAAPQAPSPARRVIEVQLRQPPRAEPRQQSRTERQRLTERYLETLGEPVTSSRRATAGPR